MIAIHDGAREAVLSWNDENAGGVVEQAAAVARIHGLGVELIAHSRVDCQPRGNFPVVLEKDAAVQVALAGPIEQLFPIGGRREPHHIVRERGAGAGRIGRRAVDGAKDKGAAAVNIVKPVAPDLATGLERVVAA